MLILLAALYDDGWGFVQDGEKYFISRPRYEAGNRPEITKAAVDEACWKDLAEPVNLEFSTWEELENHLSAELIKRNPPEDQVKICGDKELFLGVPPYHTSLHWQDFEWFKSYINLQCAYCARGKLWGNEFLEDLSYTQFLLAAQETVDYLFGFWHGRPDWPPSLGRGVR